MTLWWLNLVAEMWPLGVGALVGVRCYCDWERLLKHFVSRCRKCRLDIRRRRGCPEGDT